MAPLLKKHINIPCLLLLILMYLLYLSAYYFNFYIFNHKKSSMHYRSSKPHSSYSGSLFIITFLNVSLLIPGLVKSSLLMISSKSFTRVLQHSTIGKTEKDDIIPQLDLCLRAAFNSSMVGGCVLQSSCFIVADSILRYSFNKILLLFSMTSGEGLVLRKQRRSIAGDVQTQS